MSRLLFALALLLPGLAAAQEAPPEEPAADAPPTWETPGGAAPVRSTVSANIKTKRKVAALFKTTA